MATVEDYEACRTYWAKWAKKFSPKTILSCSGNSTQVATLQAMFPSAEVTNWGIERWSLDYACQIQSDVIVACNVFHYAPNPALWFKNCLSACKYLWLQDLFSRPRGEQGREISSSDAGDSTRYGYGNVFSSNAPVDTAFDLATYQERLQDLQFYDAGSFRDGKALINFVACLKGDL